MIFPPITARPARNFLSLPISDLQNPLKNKVSVSTLQFDNLRAGAAVGSGDESPAGVQGRAAPAGVWGQSPNYKWRVRMRASSVGEE